MMQRRGAVPTARTLTPQRDARVSHTSAGQVGSKLLHRRVHTADGFDLNLLQFRLEPVPEPMLVGLGLGAVDVSQSSSAPHRGSG